MKSNQLLIALAFTSAASAFAAPTLPTYIYSVRVPASGTTCEGAAQNLATRFQASAPKADNIKGQCVTRATFTEDGVRYTVDNIKVTYSSEYPLIIDSAQIPSNDVNAAEVYKKYSDCLNDLGQQSLLYAQATGLNPISASCIPGFDAYYGYTLKIDAIGTPARSLKTMHNLANQRMNSDASWKQQILDLITQSGGIIAKMTDETVTYYGSSLVNVGTKSWYHTDTKEQCESQAGEIASILSKLGVKHTLTACHADAPLNAGVSVRYYLDTAFDSLIKTFFVSTYNENFFSFDECMAVRMSAPPAIASSLGSFCSISDFGDGRYTLTSITHL